MVWDFTDCKHSTSSNLRLLRFNEHSRGSQRRYNKLFFRRCGGERKAMQPHQFIACKSTHKAHVKHVHRHTFPTQRREKTKQQIQTICKTRSNNNTCARRASTPERGAGAAAGAKASAPWDKAAITATTVDFVTDISTVWAQMSTYVW